MINGIMKLIYPQKCVICRKVIAQSSKEYVCDRCKKTVRPITEPRCKRCSKPCATLEQELCGDCSRRKFLVKSGYALYLYDHNMQRAVQNFKYNGVLSCGDYFADEMVAEYGTWLKALSPDAIIPVPIHPKRMRYRGFNQAMYLAERIGEHTGIKVVSDYLIRTEDTKPQKELDNKDRFSNLKKGFSVTCSNSTQYNKVVLIDDIYTTGATLEACAHVLKQAGISQIFFLCLCIGSGDEYET